MEISPHTAYITRCRCITWPVRNKIRLLVQHLWFFFHINIVGSTTAANSYTDGAVHATPINVGSISTKAEVNPRIATKQNSSTCGNPITLDYLFARFPFLVWSNTIPCLSVAPPLSLTMNGHNCSQWELSSTACNQSTFTNNTLTTTGVGIAIKSDLVRFRGLEFIRHWCASRRSVVSTMMCTLIPFAKSKAVYYFDCQWE